MDGWRWIAFAAFMGVILAGAWLVRERRRRAQRTGGDPLYRVASLDGDALPVTAAGERPRGGPGSVD